MPHLFLVFFCFFLHYTYFGMINHFIQMNDIEILSLNYSSVTLQLYKLTLTAYKRNQPIMSQCDTIWTLLMALLSYHLANAI